jgi:Arc/MetJ-type ribon-helix-helix transcriptional regulator
VNDGETVPVSVKLTKEELRELDEAIRRSKRFLNRSDAIRTLIREFIEKSKTEVTNHA